MGVGEERGRRRGADDWRGMRERKVRIRSASLKWCGEGIVKGKYVLRMVEREGDGKSGEEEAVNTAARFERG